ncbi:hypothetical protein M408DRAFT_68711 [Serendipita vermifera MAFF 305830]|uniref:sterol 22-desaturase n=1 Tax=Serendipita vermifera MAFF 305830 TaxID=933852 RepID=A0A0C3BC79_SERVB|nr:hypothetical protein M408DRAFT_68711 [Serendipita vermifera MAFF 305830]
MPSSSIVQPSSVPSQIFTSAESFSNKLLNDKPTMIITSLAILLSLLILEQTVYRVKKGSLPGSKWTIPVIGKFLDSMNPTLEGYKKQWASGELSALSVFHIFIVMATTNEYTRKILNSPAYTEPCLVASAKQVLCGDNWVFLNGKEHVDYRRTLNGLFTRKALAVYLDSQDSITRQHFTEWLAAAKKDPSPQSIMHTTRYLNMHTSLRVFCGPHIPEEAIKIISDNYWKITLALELVNFPLAIPGTKVYGAIQARKIAMKHLEAACRDSKIWVANGGETTCMIDQWVRDLQDATEKAIADGNGKIPRTFSDREMALVLLSFLFASQDAMSSGVIYMFQHLADHPEILAKVREEQKIVRNGDYTKPMTLEQVDQMVYLRAVIKESLRLKPPVTMVPYKATKAFPISPFYTVPANSMVIPSIYPSLHDPNVYEDPHLFLPDRWLDPESKANANPKNFLVFGAGPHRCIGVEYTNINMACVMGNAAALLNWEHVRTPESDEVQMIATIFPKDGCLLRFSPRQE